MSSQKSSPRFRFTGAAILLAALVFLVPALRNGDSSLYLLVAAVPGVMLLFSTVIARMFSLDRMLLSVSLYLCAAGIAAPALSDPQAAMAQSFRCGAALVALLAGGVLIRTLSPSLLTSGCAAFLGLLLLAGKLLSPTLTVPLADAALVLLLIAFAALFTRQGSLSAGLLGLVTLALLLVRGETGFALLWGIAFLLLLFAADGRPVVFLPFLAAVLLLFFGAFRLFPAPARDQSASSLAAMVSAGLVGSDTPPPEIMSLDPVSLFPGLAGHYGLIFAGLSFMLFLPFSLRGASVAAVSRSRFHAVLAMGITLMTALRAMAAALDLFGFSLFPVPEMPFITSSLPGLCSQLFAVGLLCGVSGRNEADLAEDAHLAMLAK